MDLATTKILVSYPSVVDLICLIVFLCSILIGFKSATFLVNFYSWQQLRNENAIDSLRKYKFRHETVFFLFRLDYNSNSTEFSTRLWCELITTACERIKETENVMMYSRLTRCFRFCIPLPLNIGSNYGSHFVYLSKSISNGSLKLCCSCAWREKYYT